MIAAESIIDPFIKKLTKELPLKTKVVQHKNELHLSYNEHHCDISFYTTIPNCSFKGLTIAVDLLHTKTDKLISIIQAKLHYNRTVYARQCIARRITKNISNSFLDQYHLMSSTNSAFNYGLFDSGELVAVASFSKGRKMDRLKENQRSYEMIRFCSKEGISVSGGLSKLLNAFIKEVEPGDIMTYIDKQFGEGRSYYACGFKKHSETQSQQFLINKRTFERTYFRDTSFDDNAFYLTENCGNIKLIYTLED